MDDEKGVGREELILQVVYLLLRHLAKSTEVKGELR